MPGLNILICNAGITNSATYGSIADVSMDLVESMMAVNFTSPVAMTREAIPHLEKTKGNVL